jgi:histidinol dehydrogenase
MKIFRGVEEARRVLLRRHLLGEARLPPAVWARTREVVGDVSTVEEAVRRILRDVQQEGDSAVLRYSEAFDGVKYPSLVVPKAEVREAYHRVQPEVVDALRLAAQRVRAFHEAQRKHVLQSFQEGGLGVQVRALHRVGVYVPGTTAVYPSSVLMTVIPAKVAGVEEVILTSPVSPDGGVSPLKLVAAELAGVDRAFRASGAQAVAAMAYGTESIPRVDKVCGPGNIFVTLAKREVFGAVGIDALYGPSETLVVADESADAALCAADLLAGAEHDELAVPILITTSARLAEQVSLEIERQLERLERHEVARTSLEAQGGAAIVASIEEAIDLANEFAPEHLCLHLSGAERWLERIRNAGGVFVGEVSPETLGDYVAGPSHVMPTGGTARFSSPLGVQDFLKSTSVVAVGRRALGALGPSTAAIARAEGLTGHARAIELRLGKQGISEEG